MWPKEVYNALEYLRTVIERKIEEVGDCDGFVHQKIVAKRLKEDGYEL